MWDKQSADMAKVGSQVETLRLNRVEAGLFQMVFDTYTAVIDQVISRSGEGAQRMGEVATTLRQVADTYEQEEAANLHKMKNLY